MVLSYQEMLDLLYLPDPVSWMPDELLEMMQDRWVRVTSEEFVGIIDGEHAYRFIIRKIGGRKYYAVTYHLPKPTSEFMYRYHDGDTFELVEVNHIEH